MNYVSVMIRVAMNSCYDYFLSLPLSLAQEEEIVQIIHRFAQDIAHEFWYTNTNFFFEVFDCLEEVNRSICSEICPKKPKKGPYTGVPETLSFSVEFFLLCCYSRIGITYG